MSLRRSLSTHTLGKLCAPIAFAFVMLMFGTGVIYAVEPLPDGCVRGTPAGANAPVCCISGLVSEQGQSIAGAEVKVFDTQGELGSAFTTMQVGALDHTPTYYINLNALARPIAPGDVITLQASYNGVTGLEVQYTVKRGGQNFNFNLSNPGALALASENMGSPESGAFQNITGIDADAMGNVYLWDLSNNRMQVLSPNGEWLNRSNWQLHFGQSPGEIYSNAGIAIDRKNDRVYVTDPQTGLINQYTTAGNFTRALSSTGYARYIQADGEGNLYVPTLYEGIYKYDSNGNVITHTTAGPAGYDLLHRRIGVSSGGDVYLLKGEPNGIYRYDSNLVQDLSFVPRLDSGLPITLPGAVTAGDDGHVYVFEWTEHRLYELDATGRQVPREWVLPLTSLSSGSQIHLTIYKEHLYFASQYDGILVDLPLRGGTWQHMWGGRNQDAGSIGEPIDLAVAPDGDLLYADTWIGRIGRMVNDQVVQSWSLSDYGQPAWAVPVALTFDRQGKLLVINNSPALQRFSYANTGGSVTLIADSAEYGSLGSDPGQFNNAIAIDADKNGFVYVADPGNYRVQVLREDAGSNSYAFVTSYSTGLTASEMVSVPLGIAVDDSVSPTIVYVADKTFAHITELSFDGSQLHYVRTIGSYSQELPHFIAPNHIDVGPDGSLWVADSSAHVHRIYRDGTYKVYGDGKDAAWYAYVVAATRTPDAHDLLYISSLGFGLISRFTPLEAKAPVASIVHVDSLDLVPGGTLNATGAGQASDGTASVNQYQWSTAEPNGLNIITSELEVAIPVVAGPTDATHLGPGQHDLLLRVNDGKAWSEPVTRTVYVLDQIPADIDVPPPDPFEPPPPLPTTCPAGGLWTFMLYLNADNAFDGEQLRGVYLRMLAGMQALNNPCVQAAVQIDGPASIGKGPGASDTVRWLIRPGQQLSVTEGVTTSQDAAMDSSGALIDFLRWAKDEAPGRYYYLAIADHGNGYQGINWDHTTDRKGGAYLSPRALRAALLAPGVPHINVLHLDACSMGLLEVAFDLQEKVDYLITSQYIGWGYFNYADYGSYVTQRTEDYELASMIVDRYAYFAGLDHLPYTLAALNLKHVTYVKNSFDELAQRLDDWIDNDAATQERHLRMVKDVRQHAQFFDSNTNFLNSPLDAYVDLRDYSAQLVAAGLTADITVAAQKLVDALGVRGPDTDQAVGGLILNERHSAQGVLPQTYWRDTNNPLYTLPINMTHANGISVYYPLEGKSALPLLSQAASASSSAPLTYTQVYADYTANNLFDFTRTSRWDEFLLASFGAPPTDPALLQPPPAAIVPLSKLYLPGIRK